MAKKKVKKEAVTKKVKEMDASLFDEAAEVVEEVIEAPKAETKKPATILKKAVVKKDEGVAKVILTGKSKTKFKQPGTNTQSRKIIK